WPVCFFFQAEAGIRDFHVTGVQTCALPISSRLLVVSNGGPASLEGVAAGEVLGLPDNVGVPKGRDIGARRVTTELIGFLDDDAEIGRASCGGRGERRVVPYPCRRG